MAAALNRNRDGWRYRANVAVRALAAAGGGYAVAALAAAAAARGWPGTRIEGTIVGTMLGFLVMPAAAIWAFLAASPARAAIGVAALALVLAGIAALIGPHA